MKMSGSIRRTERRTGRSVASRKASPLFAFPQGTARPGPGAHLSGLGSFFIVGPPREFCTVSKAAPLQPTLNSFFIPLERRLRSEVTLEIARVCFRNAFQPRARVPQGLRGCGKTNRGRKQHTAGAKARANLNDLTARLKSCPSQNPRESEFFRRLLKPGFLKVLIGTAKAVPYAKPVHETGSRSKSHEQGPAVRFDDLHRLQTV